MSDLISARDDRSLRNFRNKKWSIPLPITTMQLSQQEQQIELIFYGANITNSVVFNINIQNSYSCEKPAKRCRVIFDSDEE